MLSDETVPLIPGAIPVLGHLGRLGADPVGFLETLRAHGPVVRILLGRRTAYVVNSPALVRQMLVSGRNEYDKGGPWMSAAVQMLGEGLATCGNGRHRVRRPLLQPAFHHGRMPGYVESMAACASEQADGWAAGQTIDVQAEMTRLATASLTRSLFRDPVSHRIVRQFQHDLPLLLDGIAPRVLVPAVARLPLPVNRRFDAAMARTAAAIREMSRHRSAGHRGEDGYDDLLTLLLAAAPTADGTRTDQDVQDDVLTFMAGGIETVSAVISWALHSLATHPAHYRRVQDELDQVLGGAAPSYQDLARLPELQRLLTEVLRLWPPSWLLSRTTLTATELGGHRLPRGADLLYSASVLQRDPEVFADPDRFDPDRWRAERVGRAQRDAYIPFGAGARKCIGDAFGLAEATVALAVVLQRWRIRAVPGAKVRPRIRLTLSPAGVRLLLQERPVQDGPAGVGTGAAVPGVRSRKP